MIVECRRVPKVGDKIRIYHYGRHNSIDKSRPPWIDGAIVTDVVEGGHYPKVVYRVPGQVEGGWAPMWNWDGSGVVLREVPDDRVV